MDARLLAALLVLRSCALPGPELAAQHAERRLSRSDRRYWQGTLASAGAPRNELYVFVHIPKAAGASFLKDSPRHVAAGSRVKGSHEKSVHHAYTAGLLAKPAARLVLMLRHPMRLAYSQFMMCKYSVRRNRVFPRGDAANETWGGFETWARQFLGLKSPFAFGCYNPVDVQTRYLSTAFGAWAAPADALNVSDALTTLRGAFFVGLADAYQESLCLFRRATTNGVDAPHCACGARVPGPLLTRERHGLPAYSIDDLDRPKVQLLARLVPNDLVLYNAAIDRYAADRAAAAAAAAPGALPCADSVARLKLDLHATLCAAFGKNGSAARGAADCEFGEVDEGPVAVGHRRYRRHRRRKKPPAAEDGVT